MAFDWSGLFSTVTSLGNNVATVVQPAYSEMSIQGATTNMQLLQAQQAAEQTRQTSMLIKVGLAFAAIFLLFRMTKK